MKGVPLAGRAGFVDDDHIGVYSSTLVVMHASPLPTGPRDVGQASHNVTQCAHQRNAAADPPQRKTRLFDMNVPGVAGA